jgi:hypothetical protein
MMLEPVAIFDEEGKCRAQVKRGKPLRHHHTKNMNIYNSGYTRWGQRMF